MGGHGLICAPIATIGPRAPPSLRRKPMPSEPVPIRPAATIMLVRDEPAFQVLMVKRHHQIDFASGALVFPGGKTHAGDHDAAWSAWTVAGTALTRNSAHCGSPRCARSTRRPASCWRVTRPAGRSAATTGPARPGVGLEGRTPLSGSGARVGRASGPRRAHRVRTLDHPQHDAQAVRHLVLCGARNSDQLAVCDGWETVDVEWIAPGEAIRLRRRASAR